MSTPSNEECKAWIKDPSNYIRGWFYYNPEDPRMLVPKRSRLTGWMVNFAQPALIALLIFTLFLLLSGGIWVAWMLE